MILHGMVRCGTVLIQFIRHAAPHYENLRTGRTGATMSYRVRAAAMKPGICQGGSWYPAGRAGQSRQIRIRGGGSAPHRSHIAKEAHSTPSSNFHSAGCFALRGLVPLRCGVCGGVTRESNGVARALGVNGLQMAHNHVQVIVIPTPAQISSTETETRAMLQR